MAAVYTTQYLPGSMSFAEALAEACGLARRLSRRVCLNTPNDQSIFISVDGDPVKLVDGGEPTMRIGGQPFVLETSMGSPLN